MEFHGFGTGVAIIAAGILAALALVAAVRSAFEKELLQQAPCSSDSTCTSCGCSAIRSRANSRCRSAHFWSTSRSSRVDTPTSRRPATSERQKPQRIQACRSHDPVRPAGVGCVLLVRGQSHPWQSCSARDLRTTHRGP